MLIIPDQKMEEKTNQYIHNFHCIFNKCKTSQHVEFVPSFQSGSAHAFHLRLSGHYFVAVSSGVLFSAALFLETQHEHSSSLHSSNSQGFPTFLSPWASLEFCHNTASAGTKWLPQKGKPATKWLLQITFTHTAEILVLWYIIIESQTANWNLGQPSWEPLI